jgi:hypothetical protein
MSKTFRLPLLAALPALLASCGSDPDLGQYRRTSFNSYSDCVRAYQTQVDRGLQNPCQKTVRTGGGFFYYGPYFFAGRGNTRYLGYDRSGSGGVAGQGLSFDSKGNARTFSKPGTSRGGFTSGSRSRGGGSFGG